MCLQLFIFSLILIDVQIIKSQDSSNYLQSAMWDIKNRLRSDSPKRRADAIQPKLTKSTTLRRSDDVPMLSLTKGELAALYEAALAKDQAKKSKPPKSSHFGDLADSSSYVVDSKPPHQIDHVNSPSDGYYYYYYPIDSFMDHHNHVEHDTPIHTISPDLHSQYHAHTHQHNVHITSTKGAMDTDKKKHMEPLFMAVSSFIGMAVMFVLSIIFLPKFGAKSRGVKVAGNEITSLTDIVFKSIYHGDNCSERLVCEIGKRAKPLKMYNNRFTKLLKRMASSSIRWYVDGINKYSRTNLTCSSIQCVQYPTKQRIVNFKKPQNKKAFSSKLVDSPLRMKIAIPPSEAKELRFGMKKARGSTAK